MKKLSLLGLLLCLALSVNTLSSCCCMDFGETLEDVVSNLNASEGLEFISNGDGTCYVSGIGSCDDAYIVIPKSSPDRDRVTSIGYEAFYDCDSLTSVVIPDSVTSIGDYAFYWCTSLTSVVIGDSVTSIGEGAFSDCSSLTSITVDGKNANYKSIDGNLYTKDGTTLIQYAIGKTATSFVIPDSVTSIGDWAFDSCSRLTSVEIPDSVTCIGYSAFASCSSLTSVVIPDSVTSIGTGAFLYCSSLTSVVIPDSVTSIGSGAFSGCDSLIYNKYDNGLYLGNTSNPYVVLIKTKDESVTTCEINEATKIISHNAFSSCSNLTSVVIPDSVTSIGEGAFSDCYRLTSVVIPDSVTSIGYDAFFGCSSLTSVTFENPNRWWYADYSYATSGTSLSSDDLSDPSVAAKYLSSSYSYYYWFRD